MADLIIGTRDRIGEVFTCASKFREYCAAIMPYDHIEDTATREALERMDRRLGPPTGEFQPLAPVIMMAQGQRDMCLGRVKGAMQAHQGDQELDGADGEE